MVSIKSIRTGVIGIGSMGKNHARIYSEVSNLVGIADPDEKKGKIIAEKFGVTWYSDYKELLQHVDAVTVSVPTFLHSEVAKNVINSGVNLLVEKPLAANSNESNSIVNLAKKAKVVLAVGHIERYNPVITYVKNSLNEGIWGNLISIASRRVSTFPERISDVGVIFDTAIHDIDILRYLSGGEIVSVYSLGGDFRETGKEDHVSILMNSNTGIKCICEASWLTPMKARQLFLTCSAHYIEVDLISQTVEVSTSNSSNLDERNLFSSSSKIDKKTIILPKEEPLKNELNDFLKSIIMSKEPLVSGAEGSKVVRIAEYAMESLASGALVISDKKFE